MFQFFCEEKDILELKKEEETQREELKELAEQENLLDLKVRFFQIKKSQISPFLKLYFSIASLCFSEK